MAITPAIRNLIEKKDFSNLAIYLECAADEQESIVILDEIMRLRFCSDPEIQQTNIFTPTLVFNATDIATIDSIIPRYSHLLL